MGGGRRVYKPNPSPLPGVSFLAVISYDSRKALPLCDHLLYAILYFMSILQRWKLRLREVR